MPTARRQTHAARLLIAALTLALLAGLALAQRGAPGPAAAAGGPSVEYLANIGGGAPQVVIDGGYAYLAEGSSLTVIDSSDPDRPTRKAWLSLAGSAEYVHVEAMAKVGDTLVVSGERRLFTIDVGDPLQPQVAGALGLGMPGNTLAVDGGYVYLITPGPHIFRVDLSDPAGPSLQSILLASVSDYAHSATVIAGDRVYILEQAGQITIYDLQNLGGAEIPQPVGAYTSAVPLSAIAAVGPTLYLASAAGGLRVMDAADPLDLQELGSYTPAAAASPSGLIVSGGRAYMATADAGTQIIAVGSPAQPALLGTLAGIAGATALQAQSQLLMQAGAEGWQLADVSDPAQPVAHRVYPAISSALAVAVADGLVYVGGPRGSGLQIFDLSDLDRPQRIGQYPGLGIGSLAVRGRHAFARGDAPFGVYSFDLSDPAQPAQVGSYPLAYAGDDRASNIEVAGDLAYIATTQGGLQIIDVGDPAEPTLRGSHALSAYPRLLTVDGGRAYIIDNRNQDSYPMYRAGMAVVDVRNPSQPTRVQTLISQQWLENPGGLAVADGFMYLATNAGGRTQDLRSLSSDQTAGFYANSKPAHQVRVVGDLAFFAMEQGLHVVNVSDPAGPQLIAAYDPIVWCCSDMAVVPEPGAGPSSYLVYVAAQATGLHIFRVRDLPAIPTRTPRPTETRTGTATATSTPTATATSTATVVPPALTIDHPTGAPGSGFLISGQGLAAGSYTLQLNGAPIGALSAGAGGTLQAVLSTAPGAAAGRYGLALVAADASGRAAAPPQISYRLDPAAPLRQPSPPAGAASLVIPADVRPLWENALFLPLLER